MALARVSVKKAARSARLWRALLVLTLLLGLTAPVTATPNAQVNTPEAKARQLLAEMTPRERVGQLFLVTFDGQTVADKSAIYQLITAGHVGGVVLSRENNNFTDQEDVVAAAYQLTTQLQQTEWDAANPVGETPANGAYVPLLIGISQEGDSYPYDQILSGLTTLPSQMAVGATWNTSLAQQVGSLQGKELEALGFNFLLGPSLDVLDPLYSSGSQDLGVRSFGGDPYWVAEMSKAYIQGLHEGSQSRLAVIASHFPGRGSADRSPETEIATVRKSLDELKDFELEPFFAVSSQAPNGSTMTDGMLVSHIRYGIQGNIRDATRPVSFDQNALSLILQLPEFSTWRESGGLLVSDNLGSASVRRFFDPSNASFDARQVARSAFLAGNDLLYVDNFVSSDDPDQFTTITRTLDFFAQRYQQDAVFAQQVDASVERILTLKFRLYPEFDLEQVLPVESGLAEVNQGSGLVFDVARQAAALISPAQTELQSILPSQPQAGDRIVFFTDVLTARQCANCVDRTTLAALELQETVLRLYGTQTGGSITRARLTSYSFFDLMLYLNQNQDAPDIEGALSMANWVVVALLDADPARPSSLAFQRMLSEHPELLRNKNVVVFAFNAPYDLDATDITKLSAYYAMYSKGPEFLDVAARLLFQDLSPGSALPVSVPGIGYDLFTATAPDPDQTIPLSLDLPEPEPASELVTPEPTPIPMFKIGEVLPLKTGIIYDHNGHIVPDGTVVRFVFTVGAETDVVQTVEATTQKGIARASYHIDRQGLLEISVMSEPAYNSDRLRLDVAEDSGAVITAIVPTTSPTATLTPSVTPTPEPTPIPTQALPPLPPSAKTGDWVLSVAAVLGLAALAVWLGMRLAAVRWGLRWGLCMAIGGLAAYNYIALDLPGSQAVVGKGGTGGILLVSLGGVALGAVAAWVWRSVERRNKGL